MGRRKVSTAPRAGMMRWPRSSPPIREATHLQHLVVVDAPVLPPLPSEKRRTWSTSSSWTRRSMKVASDRTERPPAAAAGPQAWLPLPPTTVATVRGVPAPVTRGTGLAGSPGTTAGVAATPPPAAPCRAPPVTARRAALTGWGGRCGGGGGSRWPTTAAPQALEGAAAATGGCASPADEGSPADPAAAGAAATTAATSAAGIRMGASPAPPPLPQKSLWVPRSGCGAPGASDSTSPQLSWRMRGPLDTGSECTGGRAAPCAEAGKACAAAGA